MKKFVKYNRYLYIATCILIGLDIIYKYIDNTILFLTFFSLFTIIVINDYIRMFLFYRNEKQYYLSVFVSMIISSLLTYKVQGYSHIFMFIILYELILYTEGRVSKLFIGLEILIVMVLIILRGVAVGELMTIEFWKKGLFDIIMSYIGLLFYFLTLFTYRTLKKEKREVDRLNKELELSYNRLKEQSEEIEKLTITKERNRVAGEIHDNLGHSLIALNMNLDVIHKIMDKDIAKTKKLINKSQLLVKESIESLRKAVYALKEERNSTLLNSIRKLTDNIESTGKIRIILNINEKVEELLPEYKDIIYISIKEALTNSIKHGRADKININIKLDGDELGVEIIDNGLGCTNLIKGNGLMNIENRLRDFGGEMIYNSGEKQGFNLELIFKMGLYKMY